MTIFLHFLQTTTKKPVSQNIIKLQIGNRPAQIPSHTDGNYNLFEMHFIKMYVLIDSKVCVVEEGKCTRDAYLGNVWY